MKTSNLSALKLRRLLMLPPLLYNQLSKSLFITHPPEKFDARSVCLTVIFVYTLATEAELYFYNQPSSAPRDPLTLQREQAITSLVDWLTVFDEIGLIFGKGKKPKTAMRCNDSFEPNRLIENSDEIRAIYPNPHNYGYKTTYVSNKSPVPVAELLE